MLDYLCWWCRPGGNNPSPLAHGLLDGCHHGVIGIAALAERQWGYWLGRRDVSHFQEPLAMKDEAGHGAALLSRIISGSIQPDQEYWLEQHMMTKIGFGPSSMGAAMCSKAICVSLVAGAIALTGCARVSDVMDTGNGTYMISAHASAVRGGATGANQLAYEDAQKFCAQKGGGVHAIVVAANERDVYQSSFGGSFNQNGGGFGGGSFAAGNVNLHFRCGT